MPCGRQSFRAGSSSGLVVALPTLDVTHRPSSSPDSGCRRRCHKLGRALSLPEMTPSVVFTQRFEDQIDPSMPSTTGGMGPDALAPSHAGRSSPFRSFRGLNCARMSNGAARSLGRTPIYDRRPGVELFGAHAFCAPPTAMDGGGVRLYRLPYPPNTMFLSEGALSG